jgi:hypothetical protein
MVKLGRRRMSKLSMLAFGLILSALALLFWGATRPLPEYLVAKSSLGYGSALGADKLKTARIDLGEISEIYLKPEDLSGDLISARSIREGELIPKDAVMTAIPAGYSIIAITPSQRPSSEVVEGVVVQIWVVPEVQNGSWEPAQQLGQAEVVAKITETGVFESSVGAYELLIPNSNLNVILEGIAKDQQIFLVLGGS